MDKSCAPEQSKDGEIMLTTNENLSSPHCNESRLCDVAWLIPLPVKDSTILIKCSVTNPSEIKGKR